MRRCIEYGGGVSVQSVERPRRRRTETVERLLDAALETFAEIGFAAATVEDICRRGGFTRGAFYSSFRTKDELFGALFARETARNLARAQELLAGLEGEQDPVAAAVERCLSSFRADRTWVLVLTEYRLHAARSPAAATALRTHVEGVHTRLTELVEDAVTRSGVRLAVPPDRLARMILALHDGLTLHDTLHDPLPGTEQEGTSQDDASAHGADLERSALLLLLRSAIHD